MRAMPVLDEITAVDSRNLIFFLTLLVDVLELSFTPHELIFVPIFILAPIVLGVLGYLGVSGEGRLRIKGD